MTTVTIIQPTISEEQNHKLRCAAYCRVSSNSEDQLNSFMAQTRYYEKAFEKSDREQLVDIYADEGITGTREDKRDEFQRMISDCRKGRIDRIYTKSISRFARNTKDCLKNIRELKSLGITVLFEKENIDTADMTDEMMITIMGGLAQEESVSISKNLKWSYQKRFEKGIVNVFSAPFGFKLNNGALIIDKIQAQIVEEIFDMFLNGIGYQRISEICQSKYKVYKDKFSYYGIRYILSNEKYIGDSVYQKTFTTNNLPYRKIQNNGQLNKYCIQNTHEAIISIEIFEKAQKLIESRKHKNIVSESPFRGKLICANCGHSLLKETEHLLKCSDARTNGDPVCRSLVIRREPLEENILGLVHQYAASMLEKEKKVSSNRQCDDKEINTAELQKQSRQLTSEKMKLYDAYKDGRIDRDSYKQRAEKISVQLDEIKRKIEDAKNSKKLLEQNELSDKIKLKDFLGIQKFDTEKLREIIKVIRVHSQDEIEIEWNFDDIFSE